MSISGDLTLTDDGLIAFPPPSVHASLVLAGGAEVEAEAPWGPGEGDFDGGGGWGSASRSSLGVEGKFVWGGGTISGNARVRTNERYNVTGILVCMLCRIPYNLPVGRRVRDIT